MWASNCAGWVHLQAATASTGSVLVSADPACRSHELGFVLRKSGMKVIFFHAGWPGGRLPSGPLERKLDPWCVLKDAFF
jgi:fatty-acyl-CoA synthase